MEDSDRQSAVLPDALFYSGVAALVGLFFYLVLPGLGEIAYWNDEAGHTLLAQNVLHTGLPLAMYGKHSIEDFFYSKNALGVEAAHGWLSFYICAASFRLFGESQLAARLPFTIAGGLAMVALIFAGRLLYGRAVGLLAGLLLTVNPAFLQYCRQTRYYALVLLFTAGTLWLHQLIKRGRAHWATLSVAALLLFHSSQFICGILFASLALVDVVPWVWAKHRGRPAILSPPWPKILLGCLVLIGPWVVFFSIGRSMTADLPYSLAAVAWHWQIGLRDCWVYFPYLFLLGAIPLSLAERSYFPAAVALVSLALVAIVPEKIFAPGSGFNRRYIMHMLPLGALVAARGLALLTRWRAWAAAPLVVLVGLLPGLHAQRDIVQSFARQFRYYRHLPQPDPEKLAMATLRSVADRYRRVLISSGNKWQVIYVLGPNRVYDDYYTMREPPVSSYAVVLNQVDFDNHALDTYGRFVEGCTATIYHDRSLLRVNWAEGPEYPPAHPQMGVWECPSKMTTATDEPG
jgi:hypothetical protein